MARLNIDTIIALRNTANQISKSADYQWGHMGACNCGFLAQQVCKISKEEIHRKAMQGHGDWNEQLNDYCPSSGLPMDELISSLLNFGFTTDELKKLEKLSDQHLLFRLAPEKRNLKHNNKEDVVLYLQTWADLLEEKLLDRMELPLITLEPALV